MSAMKGAAVACLVLLCAVGYVGYDAWRMNAVEPCVMEATEQFNQFKDEAANFPMRLQQIQEEETEKANKIKTEAQAAAMQMDMAKSKEKYAEANALAHEAQEKKTAEKDNMCNDGKAIPAKFAECSGYLSGNLIVYVFAPSGMPSPQSIQTLIDHSNGFLSTTGCEPSAESLMMVSSIASAYFSVTLVCFGVFSLMFSLSIAAHKLLRGTHSETLEEPLLA